MGKVKSMLMDVEEFVYDFYDKEGNLLKSPAYIVAEAKKKFGISFGEYAGEVLEGDNDMEPHWEFNKPVSYELDDEIPY